MLCPFSPRVCSLTACSSLGRQWGCLGHFLAHPQAQARTAAELTRCPVTMAHHSGRLRWVSAQLSAQLSAVSCGLPSLQHQWGTKEKSPNIHVSILLGKRGSTVWEEGKVLISCSAQSIPASYRIFERLKKTLSQCIQPNMGSDALSGIKSFLGELVQCRMVIARSSI